MIIVIKTTLKMCNSLLKQYTNNLHLTAVPFQITMLSHITEVGCFRFMIQFCSIQNVLSDGLQTGCLCLTSSHHPFALN